MDFIFNYLIEILDRGFAGVILGAIIGYCTSYYFTDRKQLSYQSNSYFFLSNEAHNPQKINGIYSTKLKRTMFIFWNSGNQLINGDEISKVETLKIKSDDIADSLNVKLLYVSRLANKIEVECINNEIIIFFEYMNPNDGFILEVTNNKRSKLVVMGEIKGAKSIKNNGNFDFSNGRRGVKALGYSLLGCTSVIYISYIFTGFIPPKIGSLTGLYLTTGLGFIVGCLTLFSAHKHFPLNLKIDQFLDNNEFASERRL
ncbi:hypothetical protein RQP50_09335 [Paenibacillus sp. chi10]|uniref:Uncharacterized protein n=1 Tax=Paenibacillus suaedae TaxID=3077233 RepID=A0AAJ2JUE2_9BACL|nr:hypothetical protein [Paenibacillus sp. chi10]MDT8976442.1 hypothetical protein [Paenibacillus sp. chi10]